MVGWGAEGGRGSKGEGDQGCGAGGWSVGVRRTVRWGLEVRSRTGCVQAVYGRRGTGKVPNARRSPVALGVLGERLHSAPAVRLLATAAWLQADCFSARSP